MLKEINKRIRINIKERTNEINLRFKRYVEM